ncbi:protein MAIN-LIKE 1-like [Glycine soja]|uniref:protein MAIN-LIKE 1-like n=1 Tax=Glycine soja TaxID=3848 RepID=UPI00103F0E63|nr:protein MAIN-LIKE 1-like [Glycine soja]
MVRTRGLGCALGAGRGRGISEDMHEADVPLRRRPTASAQMTGAADAVQTEGVATDGSLGSPAADEGFPGGPRDPSILIDFAEHVAHSIWSGRERPDLKCSVITTDPGLISAFVERWHRETSTFHLPVGELTITLDDVASLLHLPITSALHTFKPLVTSDAIRLLTELLEVSDEEATLETRQAGGPHVRLGWLRDLYQSQCSTRRWVVAARTYLLHLVGCTLFTNKSSTHVHVVHLEAFRDLAQTGGFAWGAAALVHMYDHLNDASQCWIYEHFPTVHTSVVHDAYDEGSPRACRWLTGKAHITGIKGAPYRRRLDALSVTDVCWMPYGEHQRVRAFDLISSYTGQLKWGQIVVYVRPKRVLRQFGYLQTVPSPPVCDSLMGDDIDDRWLNFPDHLVPSRELCVVPGQVAADYMEWFFRISHPFVTRTEETAAPRHPPPPHHEEFVEPPIPEVSVATDLPTHSVVHCEGCQGMAQDLGAIAEDLERVINLRMVTEGTDLHDIMTCCLRRARGDTTDGSLRLCQRRRID